MLTICYYGKPAKTHEEITETYFMSLKGKRMVAKAKYSESPCGTPSPQNQEKEKQRQLDNDDCHTSASASPNTEEFPKVNNSIKSTL